MKALNYTHKKEKPLLVKEDALLSYRVHQSAINKHIKGIKKDYGIFFTPEHIVDLMVSLIDTKRLSGKKDIYILEPACGLAQFLIGVKRNCPQIYEKSKLFGIEVNQDIIEYLTALDIGSKINLSRTDYLLWQTDIRFDLIIGNPPYGIPGQSSHYPIKIEGSVKQKYKEIYETWYGKYNLYGAFIEKSIKLLKPDGQLVFIVPATFMILDEFKKLRKFLAENGNTAIIYMGLEVFKPEADVATVVLNFFKSGKSYIELLEYKHNRICLINNSHNWHGEVLTFETKYTMELERKCSHKLGDIYEIRISPRTPEIKNSSYIIKNKIPDMADYLPLLNGRNLKCNKIIYDNRTGYWIKKSEMKKVRGYYKIPHIVVGLGFRENGRVAAAYDAQCFPWMGDVYHLLKKNDLFTKNFDLEDPELIEYLNSDYIKRYIRELYREITCHLSITQLKNLPLPNKEEWKEIRRYL